MKKVILTSLGIFLTAALAAAASSQAKGKMSLKVGDEVYVCNCGEKCPCEMMSRHEGKCTCDFPLVKAKVTAVGEGTATFMIDGKEKTFKTAGKYACACGPQCTCNTISQSPGKCTCGKEMVEVK